MVRAALAPRTAPPAVLVPIALLIGLLAAATPAGAAIVSVDWYPDDPVEGQTLTVEVAGQMSDGCWALESSSYQATGSLLSVDAYLVDAWEPDVVCPAIVVSYDVTAAFENLAAGTYLLRVTEHHDSLRDPVAVVQLFTVVVEASVPVQARSWSALKQVYR